MPRAKRTAIVEELIVVASDGVVSCDKISTIEPHPEEKYYAFGQKYEVQIKFLPKIKNTKNSIPDIEIFVPRLKKIGKAPELVAAGALQNRDVVTQLGEEYAQTTVLIPVKVTRKRGGRKPGSKNKVKAT